MFDKERYVKTHTEFARSWSSQELRLALYAERAAASDGSYTEQTRERASVLADAYERLLEEQKAVE